MLKEIMYCPNCHAKLHHPSDGSVTCSHCGYQRHDAGHHHTERHAHQGFMGRVALVVLPSKRSTPRRWRLIHTLFVAGSVAAIVAIALVVASLASSDTPKPVATTTHNTPSVDLSTESPVSTLITPPESPATPPAESTPAPTPTPKPATKPKTNPTPTTTPVVTYNNAPPAPVIPEPPDCTVGTYTAANSPTISTSSPGLKKFDDPPQYYRVYGYTADQIRTQLTKCRPANAGKDVGGDVRISWWTRFTYDTATDSTGKCYVKNAVVGIHFSTSYPQWFSSNYDAAGLATKWQNYVSAFTLHVQGHKDIANQYASDLLKGLQNYPHTSCSTIISAANKFGNDKIAAMQTASDAYDTQTKYGATQGAVFP